MRKVFATGLWMVLAALAILPFAAQPHSPSAAALTAATLLRETDDGEPKAVISGQLGESAKFSAEAAKGQVCGQFAGAANADSVPVVPAAKVDTVGKRVTVSSLVSRALADQMQLLVARKNDLERWSLADQQHFFRWFGTTDQVAREMIYQRIHVLMLLNREYSVGNFRRAVPSRPGLFAFVHPTDVSKIYVDQAFVQAPFLGENSRPGTLCHEMSHFVLAGGTKDIAYGVDKCTLLARSDSAQALNNADNFEFFVEYAP